MVALNYYFTFYNDSNQRIGGLTPTIVAFRSAAGAVTPIPGVTAVNSIGGIAGSSAPTGDYQLSADSSLVISNGDIFGIIDSGQTGVSDSSRYQSFSISLSDAKVAALIDFQLSALNNNLASLTTVTGNILALLQQTDSTAIANNASLVVLTTAVSNVPSSLLATQLDGNVSLLKFLVDSLALQFGNSVPGSDGTSIKYLRQDGQTPGVTYSAVNAQTGGRAVTLGS